MTVPLIDLRFLCLFYDHFTGYAEVWLQACGCCYNNYTVSNGATARSNEDRWYYTTQPLSVKPRLQQLSELHCLLDEYQYVKT